MKVRDVFKTNSQRFCDLTLDLNSHYIRQNPYLYFRELRERSPVHRFKKNGSWVISRYADVVSIMKRPDLFSSVQKRSQFKTIINQDAPDHTRLRRILSGPFSESGIAKLEGRIRYYTDLLVEKFIKRRGCELMSDLAGRVPLLIITELLGIDPKRCDDLQRWFRASVFRPSNKKEKMEFGKIAAEFRAFTESHVAYCERHPENGLISDLLHAKSEGERITREEAVDLTMLLVLAGSVTTTCLMGNTILALLQNPREMEMVRAKPDLIPAVIEETLRYDTPAQTMPRTVNEDIDFGGVHLRSGDSIELLLGSANRDERQFPDPDHFIIHRNPQGHVAFGLGIHYCIGARLGRLETRIMLEVLLSRLPGLKAAQRLDRLEFLNTASVRGLKKLELKFES